MKVSITEDYPVKPKIEKKILKKYLINKKKKDEIEILLVWRKLIDEQYLSKYTSLKHIIRYGSGYDNIDTVYLKKNKIKLYNNPYYAYKDVSETTIALMFYFVSRIGEYNDLAKKKYDFDNSFMGFNNQRSFNSMNVGIIGCGKIGSEVCKKISKFASKVYLYDSNKIKLNKLFYNNVIQTSLKNLLNKSDIISIHLNLNEKTKGFVNDKFISRIGKNKIFINVSREELIENYDSIFRAMEEKKISHLGLDISFVTKSTINSKLIKRWKKTNDEFKNRIIINPHVAFYSIDSFKDMRSRAANTALNIINKKKITKYMVTL